MSNDSEYFSDADTSENSETDLDITCPYCGEVVTISVDPSGGATQEYVEDCQVCCRPWQVYLSYGAEGLPEVRVEAAT